VGASLLAKAVCHPKWMLNVQASSRAGSLPQRIGVQLFALHHSTGRALARLQLLILMHRPLERPSGGSAQWATRHGCRVSRPRPWMADGGGPTEQDRSEGMPSLGEAPDVRGQAFWLLWRFSKVTRCKSGTISRRYRRNGYTHKQPGISIWGTLLCFQIYVAQNFHKASKTIRPAPCIPGSNQWQCRRRSCNICAPRTPRGREQANRGQSAAVFLKLQLPMGPKTTWQTRTP
jgi:hypothetical protein